MAVAVYHRYPRRRSRISPDTGNPRVDRGLRDRDSYALPRGARAFPMVLTGNGQHRCRFTRRPGHRQPAAGELGNAAQGVRIRLEIGQAPAVSQPCATDLRDNCRGGSTGRPRSSDPARSSHDTDVFWILPQMILRHSSVPTTSDVLVCGSNTSTCPSKPGARIL